MNFCKYPLKVSQISFYGFFLAEEKAVYFSERKMEFSKHHSRARYYWTRGKGFIDAGTQYNCDTCKGTGFVLE